MNDRESHKVYELWRGSAEKFDYFMAGLAAALLGYLAPTLQPTRIGLNAETLELAAMLAFVGSTLAAFKRIESTVHILRVGLGRLENLESAERLSTALRDGISVVDSDTGELMDRAKIEALRENRQELADVARTIERAVTKKAVRSYGVRYYLLLLGFLLLLVARVWKGYQ